MHKVTVVIFFMWFICPWFPKSIYDKRVEIVMTTLQNANIIKPNTIINIIVDRILYVLRRRSYT